MKFSLSILGKSGGSARRRWLSHLFGRRVRTSTLVLITAFLAVWWIYDTYRPHESIPSGPPLTQVVPPGFVPDPNYTWVPRTRVDAPPPISTTPRTPTITVTTPTTATTLPPTTTLPLFPLPAPPCLLPPPFCPENTSPTTSLSQLPQPEPGSSPSSSPPAS